MRVADPQPAGEPPRFDVARADVQHLPRPPHIVERLERFLERRVGIGLVDQIHVESIRLKPFEARVDLPHDLAPRQTAVVRPRPDRVEDFRAEKELLPDRRAFRLQPSANVAFAAAAAVGIGGVEEVDPAVDRTIHQIERLRLGLAHAEELGRRADAAEVPAAQAQARDPKAG